MPAQPQPRRLGGEREWAGGIGVQGDVDHWSGNSTPCSASGRGPKIRRSDSIDRHVVDARLAPAHQPVLVELPQLVAVAAKPPSLGIVALVLEAHRDPVLVKGPEALAQRVVQFALPLGGEELDDLRPAGHERPAVAPHRVLRVGERDPLRISGVPGVLGGLHLARRRLGGERRQWRAVLGHRCSFRLRTGGRRRSMVANRLISLHGRDLAAASADRSAGRRRACRGRHWLRRWR